MCVDDNDNDVVMKHNKHVIFFTVTSSSSGSKKSIMLKLAFTLKEKAVYNRVRRYLKVTLCIILLCTMSKLYFIEKRKLFTDLHLNGPLVFPTVLLKTQRFN